MTDNDFDTAEDGDKIRVTFEDGMYEGVFHAGDLRRIQIGSKPDLYLHAVVGAWGFEDATSIKVIRKFETKIGQWFVSPSGAPYVVVALPSDDTDGDWLLRSFSSKTPEPFKAREFSNWTRIECPPEPKGEAIVQFHDVSPLRVRVVATRHGDGWYVAGWGGKKRGDWDDVLHGFFESYDTADMSTLWLVAGEWERA